jgi:hypothetical protein
MSIDSAFPSRTVALRQWLESPTGDSRGRDFSDLRAGFVLRDESSRRQRSRALRGSGRAAPEHGAGSPALRARPPPLAILRSTNCARISEEPDAGRAGGARRWSSGPPASAEEPDAARPCAWPPDPGRARTARVARNEPAAPARVPGRSAPARAILHRFRVRLRAPQVAEPAIARNQWARCRSDPPMDFGPPSTTSPKKPAFRGGIERKPLRFSGADSHQTE